MTSVIDLPTLPIPRARALALLADDDAPMTAISQVIDSDPGLTAAVLRAANSASSAPRSRIRTSNQAIVRIGLSATRRIVTGAVVSQAFSDVERAGIDVDALWQHVIATALLADAAARRAPGQSVAFTAGLLHDAGRMAMACHDPQRYARVVQVAAKGVPAEQAESVLFGATHSQWGARLARGWRLPEEITEAIVDHHSEECDGLGAAVCRARRISRALGIGDGVVPAPAGVSEDGATGPEASRDLRGARALLSSVEWYRGAIQLAAS